MGRPKITKRSIRKLKTTKAREWILNEARRQIIRRKEEVIDYLNKAKFTDKNGVITLDTPFCELYAQAKGDISELLFIEVRPSLIRSINIGAIIEEKLSNYLKKKGVKYINLNATEVADGKHKKYHRNFKHPLEFYLKRGYKPGTVEDFYGINVEKPTSIEDARELAKEGYVVKLYKKLYL